MTKTAKVSVSGVGLGLDPAGLGLGLGLGLSGLGLVLVSDSLVLITSLITSLIYQDITLAIQQSEDFPRTACKDPAESVMTENSRASERMSTARVHNVWPTTML